MDKARTRSITDSSLVVILLPTQTQSEKAPPDQSPGCPFFWQPCPAPIRSPAPIRRPELPSAPLGSLCSPPPASESLPSTSSASSEQIAFAFTILAWFQRRKDLNRHFYHENTETANWNVKICSTPLVIKEMQIKTTTRYCFTTSRVVTEKKKKKIITCVGEDVEQLDPSALLVDYVKRWQPVWDSIKSSMQGDHKTRQFFSWVPTPPKRLRTHVQTDRAHEC